MSQSRNWKQTPRLFLSRPWANFLISFQIHDISFAKSTAGLPFPKHSARKIRSPKSFRDSCGEAALVATNFISFTVARGRIISSKHENRLCSSTSISKRKRKFVGRRSEIFRSNSNIRPAIPPVRTPPIRDDVFVEIQRTNPDAIW